MTTLIALIALLPTILLLIDFARHDRFGGPRNARHDYDDLGRVDDRHHLVPHGR